MRSAREIAALTIERLAQDYARYFDIHPYLWESEPLSASRHFQDSLELPSSFDIVVFVLWSRLGTPLPERTAAREYRGIDGRAPVTGTEWEFEEALAGSQLTGKPELLVYRCLRAASFDLSDSANRERQLEQLRSLERFWARHFSRSTALGHTSFMADAEFGAVLDRTLRKLIERRIAETTDTATSVTPQVLTRPPFRGLESYEFEDASLFFGQDDSVSKAMLQLTADDGRLPFLLILGASGSGKSSLAKAGIVPRLYLQRRVSGAAFVRRVLLRPSDAQEHEDMFDAFARRLTTSAHPGEGLQEILGHGQTVQALAAHFRNSPANPAYPIGTALGALTAQMRESGQMQEYESARLVLVIDQLEELFTTERLRTEERLLFIELIRGLLESRLVWVVATMRKDFWHRADETPGLVALAEGSGRLELLPPTLAQYSQIIRRPAEVAGVGFETNTATGVSLNELIAGEVARAPRALPLLSYLLDQLYQADVLQAGGASLTYRTYHALGGLEGAIATRAETTLSRCPPEVAASLASVLFSLIQLGRAEGEVERAVSRRVLLSDFQPGTRRRALVDAFLHSDARLLVTDAEGSSEPTVRVAHEALITRWELARDFVQSHATALQARQRIEERFTRWKSVSTQPESGGPPTGLLSRWFGERAGQGLLSDLDSTDGQRLLRDYRSETAPEIVDYIERSLAFERSKRNRTVRILALLVVVVTALALTALTSSLNASKRRREAEVQSAEVRRAQQRLLTEVAATRLKEGRLESAQQIILNVLSRSAPPYPPELIDVFERARAQDLTLAVLIGHKDMLETAEFSPDGKRLLTASRDKTIREWDAETGRPLRQHQAHDDLVLTAVYSPDGRQILTASADGTARIWDAASLQLLHTLTGHTGWVRSAAYSRDGSRVVTASYDHTAVIWDARLGTALMHLLGHSDIVEWAEFSPDGAQVVTASLDRTARVWDSKSGHLLQTLAGHTERVATATYSPDGTMILTASFDRTARLWDLRTGKLLHVLTGHSDRLESGRFSPDGLRIVTAAGDATARIWDARSGVLLSNLWGHADLVLSATFSPDGSRIATASYDKTARIWNVLGAAPELSLFGHTSAVTAAVYSPDGSKIATAARDNTAKIWDARTGKSLVQLIGHTDIVNAVAFSPTGAIVATGGFDKSVRLWDPSSGRQLATLQGHEDVLKSTTFSPDGQFLATSSLDKTVRQWEVKTGKLIRTLTGGEPLTQAVYSPDGTFLLTTYRGRVARIWRAASGQLETEFGLSGEMNSAVFSSDGKFVLTGSDDETVNIWDARSGSPVSSYSGFGHPVEQAEFAPDHKTILGLSDDGVLRFYNMADGYPLAVLFPVELATSATYSPDARRILVSSSDGSASIWRVPATPSLTFQIDAARTSAYADLAPSEAEQLGTSVQMSVERRRSGGEMDAAAGTTDPMSLAHLAEAEDAKASDAAAAAGQRTHLTSALKLYARAVKEAARQGMPEDSWRAWRYRRANIARILTLQGEAPELSQALAVTE